MKEYIKNELVCLRAMEPVGSDRYNELSNAIQWIEENTIEKEAKKVENKNTYAITTIRWKDDNLEEEAIIAIGVGYDKKHDLSILFYCENMHEFEHLKEYNNGEDFVVVGCTNFVDSLD